jgi:hypothetical protein
MRKVIRGMALADTILSRQPIECSLLTMTAMESSIISAFIDRERGRFGF